MPGSAADCALPDVAARGAAPLVSQRRRSEHRDDLRCGFAAGARSALETADVGGCLAPSATSATSAKRTSGTPFSCSMRARLWSARRHASPPVATSATPPRHALRCVVGAPRSALASCAEHRVETTSLRPAAPWAPSTFQIAGPRSITASARGPVGSRLPGTLAQSSRSRDLLRAAVAPSVASTASQRIGEGRQPRAVPGFMPTGVSPGEELWVDHAPRPAPRRLPPQARTVLRHGAARAPQRGRDADVHVRCPQTRWGPGLPLAQRSRSRRASPKDQGRERNERAPPDAGRGTPGTG